MKMVDRLTVVLINFELLVIVEVTILVKINPQMVMDSALHEVIKVANNVVINKIRYLFTQRRHFLMLSPQLRKEQDCKQWRY